LERRTFGYEGTRLSYLKKWLDFCWLFGVCCVCDSGCFFTALCYIWESCQM